MDLNKWAIRWNIPYAALEDLRREFNSFNDGVPYKDGLSEGAVQSRIRLEASNKGLRLWRNNVGMLETKDGGRVRYGLANDSQKMNKKIKSSDLIGIRPIVIEQYHVGLLIGQFVAREVKRENWNFSGSNEELAQLKFLELVASMGGDASFANKEGTL